VPRRDPKRFAPVFVLAPARSCGSVVTMMLGQHPALYGLPELKLFVCPTLGALGASLPTYWQARGLRHRSPGLVRTIAEVEFGGQEPPQTERALAWLAAREDWTGAEVLDFVQERIAPRVAVEKSPDTVATPGALARLAAAYPRARYLHLTRHPLATLASVVAHRRRVVPDLPCPGEPMADVATWVALHVLILDFLAPQPPGRALRLRAEDLLGDPCRLLPVLARWLGLADDPATVEAMRHPERSPFARFAPEAGGVTGGQDPGFLADPIPRDVKIPPDMRQPAGWQGEARLWLEAVGLADCLGY
jgi:hypothetical protein